MLALVLSAAWCLAEPRGAFDPPVTIPVGARPRAVAVADIDGDGRLDIVVANQVSGDIAVLRGRGDGRFAAPVHAPAGRAPVALAVGDLDGNGAPDVVVTNVKDNAISILLNDGHARFAAPVALDAGPGPQGVTLADVDRNGVLDIAVTNRDSHDVSLYMNPRGRATAARTLVVGAQPTGLDTGDIDRDGHLDLVVASTYGDDVTVLGGNGRGGFPHRQDSPAGKWVSDVALADLDGDGDLDVGAATLSTDLHASVLLNRGDGSFARYVRYAVGRRSNAIVAGDFDLDGAIDLAISNEDPPSVALLLNRGDGTFARRPLVVPAGGAAPRAVAAADLDRDGDLDLVTADFLSDGISVIMNRRLRAASRVDIDRDGRIGRDDLAAILGAWGRDGDPCDLDDDCDVNASDVALLLRYWGSCRAPLRAD